MRTVLSVVSATLPRVAATPPDRIPMFRMRALLPTVLLLATAAAQVEVDVPNVFSPTDQNIPLSSGVGRYQQWFNANQLAAGIAEPMRFQQIDFLAGFNGSVQPAQLTLQVLVGHGKFSQVTGAFDSNWAESPTLVVPSTTVPLNVVAPGQVCLSLPFVNLFTWDRFRPVLMEIRITGNDQGNQPFNYFMQGTNTLIGQTSRVYAGGSSSALNGAVSQGVGLITRFTARSGAELDFGSGCPGEGGFVPENSMLQLPSPGIAWTVRCSNAASGVFAFWIMGDINAESLGVDLGPLFGLPFTGCTLLTNPAEAIPVLTVGGGAGGGLGSLVDPAAGHARSPARAWYTQWVVFDPAFAERQRSR